MNDQKLRNSSRGGRKKGSWKIVTAIVALALLSCGLLITLDARKVSAEKKVERKFTKEKTMATPASTFLPPREPDNN